MPGMGAMRIGGGRVETYRSLLALYVFIHIAFSMVLLAPAAFRLAPWVEVVTSRAAYVALFAIIVSSLFLKAEPLFYRTLGVFVFFPAWSACFWILNAFGGGVDVPLTFIPFLLFLWARPIYVNRKLLLGFAGAAIALSAIYSTLQALAYPGFFDMYKLPVLPLAFSQNEISGVWLGRASGFYFEPLGAATTFALAALGFKAIADAERDRLSYIFFLFALGGLLLSKSYGAILIFVVFYGVLFRKLHWLVFGGALAALIIFASSDVSVNIEDKFRELADKVDSMARALDYLAQNPLVVFLGQSVYLPSGEGMTTESTFLELIFSFGVLFPVVLTTAVFYVVYVNDVALTRRLYWPAYRRRAAQALNFTLLYPIAVMFTQNAAWIPPVVMLFVLFATHAHFLAAEE